jgi:hypothetical protein
LASSFDWRVALRMMAVLAEARDCLPYSLLSATVSMRQERTGLRKSDMAEREGSSGLPFPPALGRRPLPENPAFVALSRFLTVVAYD